MKKSINYKWKNKNEGENKMNQNSYVFTEGLKEKVEAGTIVDRLVKVYTADHPESSYEDGLRTILDLPGNEQLRRVYVKDSSTLL